jgi:spore coat polysaccharide biosynthesis protein SpsF (cytidylyltransferase family)
MSYYNFNDHFWPRQTVCSQSLTAKPLKKNTRKSIIKEILPIVCFAVWTTLLVQVLVLAATKSQEKKSLETSNSNGDCLMFRGSDRVQIYCSIPHK